jgi:hypothetical protein
MLDGDGAPLVIVNAAANVPVCVSAFVIITSRAERVAFAAMVMFAVTVVAF